MSAEPEGFHIGQWFSKTLKEDRKEWIVGGITALALSVLAWFRGKVWTALTDAIQIHPGETLLLAALGATIFSVGKWLLWKRVAKLERPSALKVSELEVALADSVKALADIEVRKGRDSPGFQQE